MRVHSQPVHIRVRLDESRMRLQTYVTRSARARLEGITMRNADPKGDRLRGHPESNRVKPLLGCGHGGMFCGALGAFATSTAHAAEPGLDGGASVWSALLPLLIVTALGIAAWIALRFFQRSGWQRNGPIRLVQAIPLGPRERLVVVSIADDDGAERRLVVGTTPQQIRLIERLDDRRQESHGQASITDG